MPIEPTGANITTTPINLFYSYALEDEPLRKELDDHLASLKREGLIAPWSNRSKSC